MGIAVVLRQLFPFTPSSMETSFSLQWESFYQKRLAVIIGIAAALFLFLSVPHAHAANLYWVGGTSDRFENASNWATQPRGSTHPAAYPGSSDLAILSYSGGTVRIRSNVAVQGILLASNWTGSLLQGSGTIKVTGATGIRVGSGRLVGGNALIQATSTTGSGFTQTGGIVSGIQNILSMSGSFKIANSSPSKPTSFTSTGTLVFSGNANQTFTNGKAPNISTTITNVTLKNSGGSNTTNVVTASGTSLTLSGSLTITTGNLSVSQASTIVGSVTIADSALAVLTVSSTNTLTLSGDWTKGTQGTFTANSSTVVLNGTTQTMSGSNTFYNLSRATAGTQNFAAGTTQTISNLLTLQGTSSHNLLLRSTLSGSRWHLAPTLLDNSNNTVTITNVDVKDSVVDENATIYCWDRGCLDSGNNVRWNIYNTPAATTTTTSSTSTDNGGGGGGSARHVNASSTTTLNAPVTITSSSTGNATIDKMIQKLQTRVDQITKKNPKSMAAKMLQKRIDALKARAAKMKK